MHDKSLERVFLKLLSEEERLDLALNEGRMDLLVEQELEDKDVAAMQKSIDGAKKGFAKLDQAVKKGMPNAGSLLDYISKLGSALDKAQKAVVELELEDPDGLANLAKKYFGQKSNATGILRAASSVQGKVAGLQNSLELGLAKVGDTLEKVISDDQRDKPLKDIVGQGNVPDEDKVMQGIGKALKGAQEKKGGFLGKMMGLFSRGKGLEDGIMGGIGDLPVEDLSTAIMGMSLTNLADLVGGFASADVAPPPESVAKTLAAAEKAGDTGAKDDVAGEEGGGEGAKSFKDVSVAVLKAVDDPDTVKKILVALQGSDDFKKAAAEKLAFENYRRHTSLSALLFETIEFEDLLKFGGADKLGDDVDAGAVFANLAKALNSAMEEELILNIAEAEGAEDDLDPEEAAAEAEEELESAAKEAAAETTSPADAVIGALDGWFDGLSATSQKTMAVKDRIGGLKAAVQTTLDNVGKSVEKEVGKAIAGWRKEHEETLVKSKRFAAKNFDQLQQLIPQLAAAMISKTNEANRSLTKQAVHRSVWTFLDRRFEPHKVDNLLSEVLMAPHRSPPLEGTGTFGEMIYSWDELIQKKWMRAAGLEGMDDE